VTPPPPPAPAIVFTPAPPPAIVFTPAPAPAPAIGFAPAPAASIGGGNESGSEVKKIDSATVVVVAPVLIEETKTAPAELKSQVVKISESAKVDDRVIVKIAPSKVPAFKGAGPFKFSLGVNEEGGASAISDPSIAEGVKVISQTPAICKVVSTFNKVSGRYAVSVQGIANGVCRITAIDSGSTENYPTATEIRRQITGIAPQATIKLSLKKPPAKKSGVNKASYTPNSAPKFVDNRKR
jgi:hypothetical protein